MAQLLGTQEPLVIYVIADRRSGSTLLEFMLSVHPDAIALRGDNKTHCTTARSPHRCDTAEIKFNGLRLINNIRHPHFSKHGKIIVEK